MRALAPSSASPPGATVADWAWTDHATRSCANAPAANRSNRTGLALTAIILSRVLRERRFDVIPIFTESRARQLLFDQLVHLAFGEFLGHANGVPDGVGVGPAVADDAHAAHPEQRGAPVLGVDRKSTRLNSSHRCIS